MEEQILSGYASVLEHEDGYYEGREITPEGWAQICKMKDKTNAIFDKRWQAAKEVIDLIAEELNMANKGFYLYAPGLDDQHPIIDAIREYVSRAGDKAQLKKRIAELENENMVLRSLIAK